MQQNETERRGNSVGKKRTEEQKHCFVLKVNKIKGDTAYLDRVFADAQRLRDWLCLHLAKEKEKLYQDKEIVQYDKELEEKKAYFLATFGTDFPFVSQGKKSGTDFIHMSNLRDLSKTKKAYQAYVGDEKQAMEEIVALNEARYNRICFLLKEMNLTEYGVSKNWLTPTRNQHFPKYLGSANAKKILADVFVAVDKTKYFFRPHIRWLKKRPVDTIKEENNKRFITYDKENQVLKIGKTRKRKGMNTKFMNYSVPTNRNDVYAKEALSENAIKYAQITRHKNKKGGYDYFLQLVMDGLPPMKGRTIGTGKTGIDVGVSQIAVVGNSDAFISVLRSNALELKREAKKKTALQRQFDRQMRINNPDCFNDNGTFKKGPRIRYTQNMRKTQGQLAVLDRQTAVRKRNRSEQIANRILLTGNIYLTEPANRAEIAQNKFGKSIAETAPSQVMAAVKRKASYFPTTQYIDVDPYKVKASQFNHVTGKSEKKDLHTRYEIINGQMVQRDLYSAFILKNVGPDAKGLYSEIDADAMKKHYPHFKDRLHDPVMREMLDKKARGEHVPASIC